MIRAHIACLAAVVGCGSVESTLTDAAPSDAPPGEVTDSGVTPDGMADAATEGPVTVTVRAAGDPVQGALVFFHDETGAQVDDATTNGDGMASKDDMPVGGYVTILRDPDASITLESVAGVQVGDNLVFDTPTATGLPFPTIAGSIDINLPQTVVDSYLVESNCRVGSPPTGTADQDVSLNISNTCPDTENIQVVVYGLEGGTRTVAQSATLAIDSSIDFFSTEAVVDLEVAGPTVGVAAEMDFLIVPLGVNGNFDVQGVANVAVPSGGSASETFGYMAGIVPRMRAEVSYEEPASLIDASHRFRRHDDFTASAGADVTLDAKATFPLFSDLSIDTAADPLAVTYEAPAALECGSLGPADGIDLFLRGFVDEATAYTWRLVVKGDTPSPIALPRLSDAAEAMYWPAESFAVHEATISAAAFSDRTYDQFRNGASATGFWLASPLLGNGDSHCLSRAAVSP